MMPTIQFSMHAPASKFLEGFDESCKKPCRREYYCYIQNIHLVFPGPVPRIGGPVNHSEEGPGVQIPPRPPRWLAEGVGCSTRRRLPKRGLGVPPRRSQTRCFPLHVKVMRGESPRHPPLGSNPTTASSMVGGRGGMFNPSQTPQEGTRRPPSALADSLLPPPRESHAGGIPPTPPTGFKSHHGLLDGWRKGWDLNPRCGFPHNRLAGDHLRPARSPFRSLNNIIIRGLYARSPGLSIKK